MIQNLKKVSQKVVLIGLVLSVSWIGIGIGQNVTRQVFMITAQAAPAASSASLVTGQNDRYENLELFQKVLHFVENNYVEPVKNKDLVYGAIKGMMETLDPHSNFLPPDVFKEMKVDTSGKFGGLGIEIGVKDNILTVISPIEDTPAWKAGLKSNDRIVKIDSESTKGMNLVEAVNKMRGKKGTDVTLSIYRDGWEQIREIVITRDIIKIQSVKSEELEPQYGYIRLTQFNENAASDVKKAIRKLEDSKKLRGLVFDMRYNPGGLLDQAVEVSSLFIDSGVVVSTIPRNKDQKEVKYARKGEARKDFAVAILVNSATASAAEIVAGALQDHNRAIIMGQPTFGKGSVQQVIELGPDMGLKLTIARYYTPSGRSIQEKGVQPDIILDDFDPKLLADARRKQDYFREKDLKGHMVNEEGEGSAESKDEYKKEELEAMSRGAKGKKSKASDKLADKSKDKDKDKAVEEDDMTPMKMNPKEDFQVREALNYIKSYDIFRKLAVNLPAPAPATAKKE
ncbi:MAG: S41 family peptidase [Oligoflexia bacterium]|nr:S41 family peptidase [Oligoflexia bacterium]